MSETAKRGYRKKGGTHGSLSKAGRIRGDNPIRWNNYTRLTKDNKPHHHKKKHKSPITNNRGRYKRQILLKRKGNKNEQE